MNIQLSDHFNYTRLLRYTLPSIAMMIFSSVYVVVDGFFVSNFAGKTAFAALNIIFPAIMVLATLGLMFGTGGSAIVAKYFGMGEREKANELFSLFVYFTLAVSSILGALGFVFIRPISVLLGAEAQLLDDCILYGRIVLTALPFFALQMMFQCFFSTAEKPNLGFWVTVYSGITNMLLDAVLVPLLPQELKLSGAALATALSMVVGGAVPLFYFGRENSSILRLGRARWKGRAILKACTNGSSEFMSNVSMNLVAMLYNIQLLSYAGEDGVAAYGVMMYVSMIFSAAFVGYSIGSAPIVSYHYGAENHRELKSLLRKSLILTGILSLAMALAAELMARPLSAFFVGYDAELLALTVSGFRIFSLSFLLMGFAIYGSGFFTALNDGLTSALISFLRTLVFQVAAVLLLPLILDIDGIWWSIVAAEFMAVVFTLFFLIKKKQRYQY